jgi:hypothetical protein
MPQQGNNGRFFPQRENKRQVGQNHFMNGFMNGFLMTLLVTHERTTIAIEHIGPLLYANYSAFFSFNCMTDIARFNAGFYCGGFVGMIWLPVFLGKEASKAPSP